MVAKNEFVYKLPVLSGSLVVLCSLVLITLASWQRFVSPGELYQQNPASYPASYPIPPNEINWNTDSVALYAQDFYILVNGEKYNAKNLPVSVSSSPVDPFHTTLEATWYERQTRIRLEFYFRSTFQVWSLVGLQAFYGDNPPILIQFPLSEENVLLTRWFTKSEAKYQVDTVPLQAEIYFQNLALLAFKNNPYYSLSLISPQTGAAWHKGITQEIKWHFEYTNQPNIILPVKTTIFLKNQAGEIIATIADHFADTFPGDNRYTWTPESWIPPGEYNIALRMEQPLMNNAFNREYPSALSFAFGLQEPSPPPIDSPADVSNDGIVNLLDIALVINKWRQVNCSCREDASGDGTVNLADIALIISSFGKGKNEVACLNSGGSWGQFPNGCADECGVGPVCTQVLTMGCDCGPDKCWNSQTLTCQ